MNRDHFLFLLIGLLGGFLGGYLAHEAMTELQPARLLAGAPGTPAPPAGRATGPMAPSAPSAPNVPSPTAQGAAPAEAPMAEINALRETLERDPNDQRALLRLADLNFDIQRWDRAAELYERYLELSPGDPDALTDLGITYRARRQFDRALELFRQAQAAQPDHWQSRFNEAVVLGIDLADLAGAERALAELRRISPGNPDVERLATELQRRQSGAG